MVIFGPAESSVHVGKPSSPERAVSFVLFKMLMPLTGHVTPLSDFMSGKAVFKIWNLVPALASP